MIRPFDCLLIGEYSRIQFIYATFADVEFLAERFNAVFLALKFDKKGFFPIFSI